MLTIIDRAKLFMFGDAIGRPYEFMLRKGIISSGIIDAKSLLDKLRNKPFQFNQVSDDTQLMYLTVKSIMEGTNFYDELSNWYNSVVRISDAPGDACIYAAKHSTPCEDSIGPGALMRMPAYCVVSMFKPHAFDVMINNAEMTHSSKHSTDVCKQFLDVIRHRKLINVAPHAVEDDAWTAEDILNRVMWLIQNFTSMDKFLYDCVVSDGDSDTVAAIGLFLISYFYPAEAKEFLDFLNQYPFFEVNDYSWKLRHLVFYYMHRSDKD